MALMDWWDNPEALPEKARPTAKELAARIAGLKEALELCDTYFHGTDCRAAITFRISQLEKDSNV